MHTHTHASKVSWPAAAAGSAASRRHPTRESSQVPRMIADAEDGLRSRTGAAGAASAASLASPASLTGSAYSLGPVPPVVPLPRAHARASNDTVLMRCPRLLHAAWSDSDARSMHLLALGRLVWRTARHPRATWRAAQRALADARRIDEEDGAGAPVWRTRAWACFDYAVGRHCVAFTALCAVLVLAALLWCVVPWGRDAFGATLVVRAPPTSLPRRSPDAARLAAHLVCVPIKQAEFDAGRLGTGYALAPLVASMCALASGAPGAPSALAAVHLDDTLNACLAVVRDAGACLVLANPAQQTAPGYFAPPTVRVRESSIFCPGTARIVERAESVLLAAADTRGAVRPVALRGAGAAAAQAALAQLAGVSPCDAPLDSQNQNEL